MRIRNNLKSFKSSFGFAFKGICYAIRYERNFRIHMTAAFYVMLFSSFYNFTKIQNLMLIIIIALVMIAELFNTAIEAIVDLVSPEFNPVARIVKDVSAGAVLITSIGAFVGGLILFLDVKVIREIICYFYESPIKLGVLIALIITSTLFVFGPKSEKECRKYKE